MTVLRTHTVTQASRDDGNASLARLGEHIQGVSVARNDILMTVKHVGHVAITERMQHRKVP